MIQRLKRKWGVTNNFQFAVILFVFSAAGSSVLFVRKALFALMGVGPETPLWIKVPLWLLVVFPSYQVLLVSIGGLCGQWNFFWNFEKKMLRRMRILRDPAPVSAPSPAAS